MSLGKTIDSLIHDKVVEFVQSLDSTETEKNKLIAKWTAFFTSEPQKTKESEKKTAVTTAKKSSYQFFFAGRRAELKKKEPGLTFGELSKKISKEWSQLTPQQKESYTKPKPAPEFTIESLNQKKMDELRALCEQRGIVKGGNKSELIRNLLSNKKQEAPKPPPEKKTIEQVSFDVFVSTRKDKRSDYETEKADYAEEGFVSEIGSDADSKEDDEESLEDAGDENDDPMSDLDED
jgi:hypothetical protein